MNADKCPHCGSGLGSDPGAFACGSWFNENSGFTSALCLLRSKRVALQKAERELERERWARIKMQDEMERQAELATLARTDMDAAKAIANDMENRVIGGAYAAVLLRRHCGLDDTKEDLGEVAELVVTLRNELAETLKKLEKAEKERDEASASSKTNATLLARTLVERDKARRELDETRRKLEEARRAVRYLFYSRNATGETVSDAMHEMEPERWREIYKILNPDAEKGGAS